MKKRGLGKGLDLIFAETNEAGPEGVVNVKISEIEINRDQPRKDFDLEALSELTDSVAQHGILQPLLLRPIPSGGYRIVAGERRFRAAKIVGLTEVPALIREMTDSDEMLFALVENLQREDLNPIDEANAYKTFMDKQGCTQDELAESLGISRSAITNAMRLLSLPNEVQILLKTRQINAGQARAILRFSTEDGVHSAAEAARDGATVRELEEMAQREVVKPSLPPLPKIKRRIRYYDEAALAIGEYLGRRVKVAGTENKGSLQIEFYGENDLSNLLKQLKLQK